MLLNSASDQETYELFYVISPALGLWLKVSNPAVI
jgi:hypothetical protein